MKNEVMQRIAAVLNALDNVYVKGRQNLANLSGSITILEETAKILSKCEFVESDDEKQKQ